MTEKRRTSERERECGREGERGGGEGKREREHGASLYPSIY